MFEKFKPAIVLTSICLVVALLLSGINMITAPEIARRQNLAASAALLEVLPNGTEFNEVNLADYPSLPTAIASAWIAPEGCVIKTITKGYANGLTLMIGIDNDGKIVNTKVIASGETYGLETKLDGEYNNATLDNVSLIIAAGASAQSNTSKGYYDGVLAALQAFAMLGGQEVDTREPDVVFKDNLNIVLGTEGKKFTRWFATETLTGVSGIYTTTDAADGVVILIGETFVAVKNGAVTVSLDAYDKSGKTSDTTAENKAIAESAYAIYSAAGKTEIAIPDGAKSTVLKAYITASGNYVFDMITSDSYHMSGEHVYGGVDTNICFSISMTADGKIIDVITTKHGESKNFGDACASESFYASLRGATREQILDLNFSTLIPEEGEDANGNSIDQIPSTAVGPGVITSATFTTVYYQNAVLDAFDAFLTLTAKGE